MRPSIGAHSPISIQPILVNSPEATAPSLLLSFEQSRYLFNCPENTSRSFVQSKITQKHLQHIFLPSSRADYSSGLYGMLMGLADSNKSHVRLIGPDGLRYMLSCGRLFTRRKGFDVHLTEFIPSSDVSHLEKVFEDQYIRVYALGQNYLSGRHTLDSGFTENDSKRKMKSPPILDSDSPATKRTKLESAPPSTIPTPIEIDSNHPENRATTETKIETSEDPKERLTKIIQDMFRTNKKNQNTTDQKKGKPTPAYSYSKLETPSHNYNVDPTSYLIVGPRLRGKFLPKKAQKLGIKPGPCFAKLVNGESIEISPNKWVTSEMCMEGGSSGSAFLISNVSSLEQLMKMELIRPACIYDACDGAQLEVVYHFVHQDVISHHLYLEWISTFNPKVKHYLSTPGHCPEVFTFESSALLQLKLNTIYPDSFPIPKYSLIPNLTIPNPNQHPVKIEILNRFETLVLNSTKNSDHLHLKSKLNYDFFEEAERESGDKSNLRSKLKIDIDSAMHLFDTPIKPESEHQSLNQGSRSNQLAQEIVVTTLGTGSAVPSKYRNVSSTLLHIPTRQEGKDGEYKFHYVLLDAGEGTLGQIKRKFGSNPKDENEINEKTVLKNLVMIFISHLHADHHSGLFLLLKERAKIVGCRPLALVCQYGIYLHLLEKSAIESIGLPFGSSQETNDHNSKNLIKWFDSEGFVYASADKKIEINHQLQNFISSSSNNHNCFSINVIPVIHWGKCYGICLENTTDKWKIVFSGDTRPCQALIEAGKDADVLIHEASLGPDQVELARIKGHSTVDQAIEVGLKMKAKHCILNHFSGRYPKIPPSIIKQMITSNHEEVEGESKDQQEMKIAISFDLMTCKIKEIGILETLIPVFEQIINVIAQDEGDIDEDEKLICLLKDHPEDELIEQGNKEEEGK